MYYKSMRKPKKSSILNISPYKDKNIVIYKCITCGESFGTYQGSRQQNCDDCISKKVKQGRPRKTNGAHDVVSKSRDYALPQTKVVSPKLGKPVGFNLNKDKLNEIKDLIPRK